MLTLWNCEWPCPWSGLNEPRVCSFLFLFSDWRSLTRTDRTRGHFVIICAREGRKSRFDNSSEHVEHANEIKCWTSLVSCVCERVSEYINTHSRMCWDFFPRAAANLIFCSRSGGCVTPDPKQTHLPPRFYQSWARSPGVFRCSEAFVLTRGRQLLARLLMCVQVFFPFSVSSSTA